MSDYSLIFGDRGHGTLENVIRERGFLGVTFLKRLYAERLAME